MSGNLIGPPFAGWLYDYSKEWFLTFGLCGLFIGKITSSYKDIRTQSSFLSALSGLCLLVIPAIIFVKQSYFKLFKTEQRECNGKSYVNAEVPTDV